MNRSPVTGTLLKKLIVNFRYKKVNNQPAEWYDIHIIHKRGTSYEDETSDLCSVVCSTDSSGGADQDPDRPGSGHVPGADGAARRLPARPEARCAEHNSIYACGARRCPGICRLRRNRFTHPPVMRFYHWIHPRTKAGDECCGDERGL